MNEPVPPRSRLRTRAVLAAQQFLFRRHNRWYHYVLGAPLWLLSLFYRLLMQVRDQLASLALKVPCQVISVGNLTLGGSGKTPVVEWLARYLRARGLNPAILCRGHEGSWRNGAHIVSDGVKILATTTQAGDEAMMLSLSLQGLGIPVLVGRRRASTAKLAWQRFGPDVLLVDDGFQHQSLAKDIEILVVNGQNPSGAGNLIPFGPLRQPMSALSRSQLIWVTRWPEPTPPNAVALLADDIPVICADYKAVGLRQMNSEVVFPVESLKDTPIMAFSGIADPGSFFQLLEELGLDLRHGERFPDHHWFQQKDLASLRQLSAEHGVSALVTTEKDLVRLPAEGSASIFALVLELRPHRSPNGTLQRVLNR